MSSAMRSMAASIVWLAASVPAAAAGPTGRLDPLPAAGTAAISTEAMRSFRRFATVPMAPSASRGPFASAPVSAAALARHRGGDGVFNDAQLKGVVADNQAVNVTTGSNAISDGAFAGSAGLSTVIQNSGNNVLIQNATIVNLQLK